MKMDTMAAMGQLATGAADKQEGTLYSLLNFFNQYQAAKRSQITMENVNYSRDLEQQGYSSFGTSYIPNDQYVSQRVWQDLLPFGHDLFNLYGKPAPTGEPQGRPETSTTPQPAGPTGRA